MNAKPLFTEDKSDIVAYYCSKCRIVKQTKEQADECCTPPAPILCDCGNQVEKYRPICASCAEQKRTEKFNALPCVEWDGVTPLTLYGSDDYFFDFQSIADYAEDRNIKPADLKLLLCEPNYAGQVETDYWEDNLPEDGDFTDIVSDEISAALAALNKAIGQNKTVLSWSASDKRILLN